MAFTLLLVLFNRLQSPDVVWLCAGISLALIFAFSDWALRKGLTVAEHIGRSGALILCCGCVGLLVGWHFWPKWTLTSEQKAALVGVAMEMPKEIALVVEYPPAYNKMGQQFGKEIRQVFEDSGARVNKITVIHAAVPAFEGLVVLVPREPLDGSWCASYRYGVALSSVMAQAGIHSTLAEDRGQEFRTVDCSSLGIYVGNKPIE